MLLPSLLGLVGQYINWAITLSFMPLLAEQLGAPNVGMSFLVSVNIAVFTVTSLLSATTVERLGARKLLRLTFSCTSGAIALAALVPTLPFIFVAQLSAWAWAGDSPIRCSWA